MNRNIASLGAQRQLSRVTADLEKSYQRLASGLRINRASDDAAGLSISSLLRVDSRVYNQATRNISDGQSMLSIAEGALSELSNVTIRLRELATQSANGVFSLGQRSALHLEANTLVNEFNRIVSSVNFNGLVIFDRELTPTIQIQAGYGSSGLNISLAQQLSRTVGDGTFQTGTVTAGSGTGEMELADFNSDGNLDMIRAQAGNVHLALGNGDGTFQAATPIANGTAAQGQLTVGDINGDGFTDVLTASSFNANGSILLSNGNGTFQSPQIISYGSSTSDHMLGDINGDGLMDIITLGGGSIRSLIQSAGGSFSSPSLYASTADFIDVGDFNGDGRTDIAATALTNANVQVLFGQSNGSLSSTTISLTGGFTADLAIGDYDGDGIHDIAAGTSEGIRVLSSNGDGTFDNVVLNGNYLPGDLRTADLNGDGLLDLISEGDYLIGNGDGTFADAIAFDSGGMTVAGISLGDMNNDGAIDVLGAQSAVANYSVILANTRELSSLPHFSLASQADARYAMQIIDDALARISAELGAIGSMQSRLGVAYNNLTNSIENFESANSRITDVDAAEESAQLVRSRILQQASSAILTQANSVPELALLLLGSG